MKCRVILLLLFFRLSAGYSQSEEVLRLEYPYSAQREFARLLDKTMHLRCSAGRDSAIKYLEEGKLCVFVIGLTYTNTFSQVLYAKYKVLCAYSGCHASDFAMCFNEIMEPAILKRYGNNVLAECSDTADSIDRTGQIRMLPQYKEYNPGAYSYIYSHLSRKYFSSAGSALRFTIRFNIDTSGRVTDVRFDKAISEPLQTDLLNIMASMKDWLPAQIYGTGKMKASYALPITLSHEEYSLYCSAKGAHLRSK